MRRVWRFLALGAGVYVLVLLITFPAARVAGFLEQNFTGLSVRAVDGSVVSGRAGRVSLYGQELGSASWSLRPSALLLARVEYHVTVSGPVFDGGGSLAVGPGGDLRAHDIEGILKPDAVVNRFAPLPVTTAGDVHLALDRLQLAEGFPVVLSGALNWTEAALREPVPLVLGNVQVDLDGDGERISGVVSNSGGEIDVSGELSWLASKTWRLQLQLQPGPGTGSDVSGMLESFGEPLAGGAYRFTESGTW